jgi:TolA-binding protein
MHSSTLHYRCVFDLAAATPDARWHSLLKTIRAWAARRVRPNDAYWKDWFLDGGTWSDGPSVILRTAAHGGDADAHEYWAMQFEHPDTSATVRQWRTEIGLTKLSPRSFRVSIALSQDLIAGFIGSPPPAPLPSAPKVVSMLLTDRSWVATAGSERLSVAPRVIPTGEGNAWVDRLRAKDRRCALVFVSRTGSGEFLVDPARLARLLAGVAVVAVPDGGDLDEELQYLLPKHLRTWNGAVRVYLPGVTTAEDGHRHRFFEEPRISALGPRAVEDAIVEALARRSPILTPGVLTTLLDVEGRRREARLSEVRAESNDAKELREWVKLLEADNDAALRRVDELADENGRLRDQLDDAQGTIEDAQEQLRRAQIAASHERSRATDAEARARTLEGTVRALNGLDLFPRNAREVAELAGTLFPTRLVFTQRAMKSAEDATINKTASEMDTVWQCLRSMATVLHPLHFDESERADSGTIIQRFEAKTRFGLAVTESSMTKADAKLMKLRKCSYKDREVDVSSHVKYDNGKRFLRVHYYADPEEQVLVVDHCGDHLDTAGTRRLS